MSDCPKYRLKKDTPNFEAGSIFVIHSDEGSIFPQASDFIYDPRGNYYDSVGNIKHFDEWFEEVKEEPTWVRKQIKRVDITALNEGGESDYKYTDIQYRFIKPFYYDDEEWGVGVCAKNDTSYQRFYMDDKPGKSIYLNKVAFINQLIRDGYIEIKNNPNIVWEDEDD